MEFSPWFALLLWMICFIQHSQWVHHLNYHGDGSWICNGFKFMVNWGWHVIISFFFQPPILLPPHLSVCYILCIFPLSSSIVHFTIPLFSTSSWCYHSFTNVQTSCISSFIKMLSLVLELLT